MANPEHLAKLKEGVSAWNSWRWSMREHVDLSGADLSGADLNAAILNSANLYRADLTGADLYRSKLWRAHVWRATLRGANLFAVDLTGANLSESLVDDANLGQAKLVKTNVTNAHLSRVNLIQANLEGADLTNATLRGANLSYANLRSVKCNWADLTDINLSYANITRADFTNANLGRANLNSARAGWTIFAGLDLSAVKHLETVEHTGPSSIGVDTIYKSHGNIPAAFLRGAGVPETFITYTPSLLGPAIEFYSCFISYSSQDGAFTERLHSDLRAKNLRVWFAFEDLKIGDRFQERIEESIRLYDKVMIVLSEASVSSRWVEREVNAAREREDRESRTVLFPIRIDGAVIKTTQPWAADLRRTRHIGDFTRWKDHDSYQKAFERLLRDLRADSPPNPLSPEAAR